MFLHIFNVLLLILATCLAQNGCPSNSNIKPLRAHETDCEKFYQCSNGQDFVFTCGPGTVFDEKLQVCNWPSAVNCKTNPKKTTPPKGTKTSPSAQKPKGDKKLAPAKDTKKPSPPKAAEKPAKG